MNWIDLVILIVLFIFIVHGAVKGAAHRLVLIVAAILAFRYTNPFGNWLAENILPMFQLEGGTQSILVPIASFIILLVVFWAIGSFFASFFKEGAMAFINHILGAALGFVIACALVSVVLAFSEANFLSPAKTNIDARKHSKFYYPLAKIGSDILSTKFRPEQIKIDMEDITDFSKDLKKLQEQNKK